MAAVVLAPTLHNCALWDDVDRARALGPAAAPLVRGRPPLFYAAYAGHAAATRLLLAESPSMVGVEDSAGHGAVYYAACGGSPGVVGLLASAGYDVSTVGQHRDPEGGHYHTLHFAAEQGHAALVASLLGRGDIDPAARDPQGETALVVACLADQAEVVRLLLADKRVPLNKRTKSLQPATQLSGCSALHVVRSGACLDALLQRKGLKFELQNARGETPLHHELSLGRDAQKVAMLASRIDLTKRWGDANVTALMSACALNDCFASAILAAAKDVPALLAQRDATGWDALFYAVQSGNVATVAMLLDAGAATDVGDDQERTAADVAREFGRESIAALLESHH